MSHTITLELTDEEFAALHRLAETTGRTPSEMLLDSIRVRTRQTDEAEEMPADTRPLTPADFEAARRRTAEMMAASAGQSPEEILAEWRVRYSPQPRPSLTEAEEKAALDELLAFSGVLRTGDPFSSDNERIDADLAREYGSTHEDEA